MTVMSRNVGGLIGMRERDYRQPSPWLLALALLSSVGVWWEANVGVCVVVCDGLTGHISLCRSPKARHLVWLTEVDGGRLEMSSVDMCWKEKIGSCSDVP